MANRLRVEEYLRRFVTEFVIIFEEYFSEYYLGLLKKIHKKGDWSKLAEGISHLARPVEGVSVFKLERTIWVIGVIQKMVHSVGVHYDEEKLRKVSATLVELRKNPLRIRENLIESAAIIFQSFESQLMEMESTAQNWCDLDKVVHDAVNRVISYYKKNPGTLFKRSSITTAVILGESKHYHGSFLPRGHTVTINKTSANTKDLFERVGLKHSSAYYHNSQTKPELGYRFAFDWEQSFTEWDSRLARVPLDQYEYCVDEEMISRTVRQVVENISSGLEIGKFNEALRKISLDAERDVTRLWLLIENNFCKVMKSLDALKDELNSMVRKSVQFTDEGEDLNPPHERVWFDLTAPTELFVGRNRELKDLHSKIRRPSSSGTVTAICGLDGMGKTQLARQYTYLQCTANPSEFFHIIWLNAENEKSLMDSFHRLATRILRPPALNAYGRQRELIVHDVYKFLSSKRTLMVIDNVENREYLKHFLPQPSVNACLSIVLVSRCSEWDIDIETLNLSEFTHTDAEDFVKKSLGGKGQLKETKVNELVKKLNHFPLAVQLAVAYIRERNFNINTNIDVFLKKYEREQKLGTFKDLTSSDDVFAETAFYVWNVSYGKMKKDPISGDVAVKILNILAFLSMENVDCRIFNVHFLEDEENSESSSQSTGDIERELEDSFHLLTCYGFVEGLEWQRVSINRLIQKVTRLQIMQCEKLRDDMVFETFEVLQTNLVHPEKELDISRNMRLLPLLETFLFHITNLKIKQPEKSLEVENFLSFLNRMGKAYGGMGESVIMIELYETAYRVTENYYGKNHFKVAQALNKLANAYESLGKLHEKMKCLEKALKIQEEYYETDHLEMVITLNNLGNTYGKVGEYNKMVEYLERVLITLGKPCSSHHSKFSTVLYNLGFAYGQLGNHRKQRDYLERALQINDTYNATNYVERARFVNNLGNAYGALGDHCKQVELYETALALRMQLNDGEENADVARSLHNLGTAYGDLGNHKKKKELLERALTIEMKHYGENHIEVATTLYNLGIAWGNLGDHWTKKELLEKALGIEKRHYGQDHIKVVITQYNLAISYRDSNDLQKSEDLLLKTLKIQEVHFKEETIDIAYTLCALGTVYNCLEDYIKQVEVLERALRIQLKYYKPNSLKLAGTLDNLGSAYGHLGEYYKQKESYTRVLGIRERHFGSNHPEVARTENNLGNAEYCTRNYLEAKDKYESALQIKKILYKEEFIRVAHILNNLGSSFNHLRNHKKAKELLGRSLAMKVDYYGKDHCEVDQTIKELKAVYNSLGGHLSYQEFQATELRVQNVTCSGGIQHLLSDCDSHSETREIEKKKSLLEATLEIEERTRNSEGMENLDVATTIYKLGITHGELGNHKTKVESLERVLKIQEDHYGCDNTEVSMTLFRLGEAYGCLGNHAKQREALERALEVQERDRVAISKLVATLDNLGNAYGAEGDLKKQKELYYRSLSMKRKYFGMHHVEVAKTLNKLGNVCYLSRDYRSAKELYEQALAIEDKLLHDGYTEIAHILNNLGCSLLYLDDIERAKMCLEEALAMKKEQLKEEDFEVDRTLYNLGTVYYKFGCSESPSTLLQRSPKMYDKYREGCSKGPRTLNKLAHLSDFLKAKGKSESLPEARDDNKEYDFEGAIKLRHLEISFKLAGDHESAITLDELAKSAIANYYDLPSYYHLTYL